MTYSNKFVMCVMVNGRPLKERADGIVQIPMNTEYAIRFKNKNSRRAMVTFTLDAENASGNGYIINAYSDLEIKRFADRDQTFKFVDLNGDEAQLEGKNGPNLDGVKGVIQANFHLEKQPAYQAVPISCPYPWPTPRPPFGGYRQAGTGQPWFGSSSQPASGMSLGGDIQQTSHMSMCGNIPQQPTSPSPMSTPRNFVPCSTSDFAAKTMIEGVTVGGQSSGQTFTSVAFDAENDFVTLRIALRGTNEPVEVIAAQVESEYCTKCGAKKARKNDAFCGKCGARL